MYLFNRRTRLATGNLREAMTWAAEITEKVNKIAGVPVTLWSGVFGPEVGTLVWSSFVPDLVTLEAATDRLQADQAFGDLADRGAKFTQGGADDGLAQLIHGEPDLSRRPNYVSVVQAICANRNLARGLAVGVEIAQMAEKITGTSTMFASAATGPYGSVAWFNGFDTVQELEAQQEALAADAGWLDFLDREAGTAYQENPAATVSRIYRRVA